MFLYFRLQYFAEGPDDLPCSLILLQKDDQDHATVIGHSRLNQVLGKPDAAFLTCGKDWKTMDVWIFFLFLGQGDKGSGMINILYLYFLCLVCHAWFKNKNDQINSRGFFFS